MSSYNRVILVGNLGNAAELKSVNGTLLATFSIATTETWKDRDGTKRERTEWTRVSYWGKSAEAVVPYLERGKSVLVEGRLSTSKYQAKDGTERTSTEIRADRVVLLGGPRDSRDRSADQSRATDDEYSQAAPAAPVTDDEIPF